METHQNNMPSFEKQPLEQRQAYAIEEFTRIVEKAESIESAQEQCNRRLMEMIDQHILPNNQDEVQPVIEKIIEKINVKYEAEVEKKLNEERARSFYDRGEQQIKNPRGLNIYSDSVDSFKKATELCPENEEYFFKLGLAQYKDLQFRRAQKSIRRAIELNPKCQIKYYKWLVETTIPNGNGRQMADFVDDLMSSGKTLASDESELIGIISKLDGIGRVQAAIWLAKIYTMERHTTKLEDVH